VAPLGLPCGEAGGGEQMPGIGAQSADATLLISLNTGWLEGWGWHSCLL
jgi:hypothetical protein